jgi:hypothetical protein
MSAFNKVCSRLNVKPKQFAILLVISTLALGVLGLKMFVLKPKSASAAGTKATARKGPDKSPAKPGDAKGAAEATTAFPALEDLPVVPVVFENRPMRDPFVPFFVYHDPGEDESSMDGLPMTDEEGGVLVAPRTNSTKGAPKGTPGRGRGANAKRTAVVEPEEPLGPQGVVLKAIIEGKVAVLSGMTVEQGDIVEDADGQKFTVLEIRERSVTLSDGRRTWPIGYAANKLAGKPGAKK